MRLFFLSKKRIPEGGNENGGNEKPPGEPKALPQAFTFSLNWANTPASRASISPRPMARGCFRHRMTSWLRRSLRHWMGRKSGLHYPKGCTLSS